MHSELPRSQSYSKLRSESRRFHLTRQAYKLAFRCGRLIVYYLLFLGAHAGLFAYAMSSYLVAPEYTTARDTLGKYSFAFARSSAFVLSADLSVIVFTMCRMSITFLWNIKFLKWIPFQHLLTLHKDLGLSVVLFTLIHVGAHYINFLNYSNYLELYGLGQMRALFDDPEEWSLLHPTGYTGQIAMIALFLIISTSSEPIRRKCFELFWNFHHLFYVFMAALVAHGAFCFVKTDPPGPACKGPSLYKWIIASMFVYTVERIIREIRSRRATSIVKVVLHPSQVLEIQFKKPSFSYRPGQYMYLQCPEISSWQWHPFTITSAPEERTIAVHIRIVGDWTRKLGGKVGIKFSNKWEIETVNPPAALPKLRFDGPYGAATQDVFKYEVAVCIGAGIGQTPFSSILKHIWYQHRQDRSHGRLKKVYFYGICRDTQAFEWFHDILKALEAEDIDHFIDINSYLTGALREDQVRNVMINDMAGQCDAITRLRNPTHFGRPKFDQIFSVLKEKHAGTNIGVFCCGPVQLSDQLSSLCKEFSSKRIGQGSTTFTYNKENF